MERAQAEILPAARLARLGFDSLKVIEVAGLIEAQAAGRDFHSDSREALEVQRLEEAIATSSRGTAGSVFTCGTGRPRARQMHDTLWWLKQGQGVHGAASLILAQIGR